MREALIWKPRRRQAGAMDQAASSTSAPAMNSATCTVQDESNASTFRERVGFKTMKWNGFSLLAEGEFTQVAVADYNAGAGPRRLSLRSGQHRDRGSPERRTQPGLSSNTTASTRTAKVGREKIIYDNAAFIGNVGWRQNEQTFDAVTVC